MPLERILEPEVMDSAQEARDYDTMDHSAVNRVFVDDLLAFVRSGDSLQLPWRVLDVGTGTAQIPVELAARPFPVQITGIDMAGEMLNIGRQNVSVAGQDNCISLQLADAKCLPFDAGSFDLVMSNSIVHHIPSPLDVLVEMARVVRGGGVIFVRDLMRPQTTAEVEQFVARYAAETNDHQRQLFRQSLHAALTVEEVRSLLVATDLPAEWCTPTSDRHWTIAGQCGV